MWMWVMICYPVLWTGGWFLFGFSAGVLFSRLKVKID